MISNEKEIWTVGFSKRGRWQVRKASIDSPYEYTLIEDLGPSLKAAYLEADGDFVYLPGQAHLSLITQGVPWLFIITDSGSLYAKKVAEPINTAILLDTDVEEACACRGWKSDEYGVDSGLLVAYRKQTGAYLRAYVPISGVYTWDGVQTLASRPVQHIEIKRMNDYRLGVLLDNELMLSDRYYIGGTSKTEFIDTNFDIEFEVLSLTKQDGEHEDFRIESVELKNQIEFWVRGNYPFYSKDNRWSDLSITTTVSEGQGIESWRIEDGVLKIKMLLPITSTLGYMSFRIREVNRVRFQRTPQSRPIVPQIDIVYEAPPVPYAEYLAAELAYDLTVTMREQRKLSNYLDEHLSAELSHSLTISMRELGNIMNTFDERFAGALQVALSPIVTEQVGDKPI